MRQTGAFRSGEGGGCAVRDVMRNDRARDEAHLRSNGWCQLCGWRKSKQAHHWALIYPSEEDLTANDLTALCKECHDIATELRRYHRTGADTAKALAVFSEASRGQVMPDLDIDSADAAAAFTRSDGKCQICGRYEAAKALSWSRSYPKDSSIHGGRRLTALCETCYEVATTVRRYLHMGHELTEILRRFCAAFDSQSPLFEYGGLAPPPLSDKRTFGGPLLNLYNRSPSGLDETDYFGRDESPLAGQTRLSF